MNILNLKDWNVLGFNESEHDYRFTAEYTIHAIGCPKCSSFLLHRFGTKDKLVMDVPIHGKRVGILVQRQRYRCPLTRIFAPVG
jgi:transposase